MSSEHYAAHGYTNRAKLLQREKKASISYNNLVKLTGKGVQREELPELVNVTERDVLSFRVLNNPLNSIPTLQIHTEKQKIKEDTKAGDRRTPLEIGFFFFKVKSQLEDMQRNLQQYLNNSSSDNMQKVK